MPLCNYKRLAHLENITLPNGLRGKGIHRDKCTISQVLLHHIVFFFAWIQHPCGLGEYARVKFLSWCTIFLRPNFPLTAFPSTLPCCTGNSFHLLTSPGGLRGVESIHLLGKSTVWQWKNNCGDRAGRADMSLYQDFTDSFTLKEMFFSC